MEVVFYCGLAGAAIGLLYIFEIFAEFGEGRKKGRRSSGGEDDDGYYADGYYDEP